MVNQRYYISLLVILIVAITDCGLVADAIEDKIRGENPRETIEYQTNEAVKDGLMGLLGIDPAMFDEQQADFSATISTGLELNNTKVPGEISFHDQSGFNMAAFRRYMQQKYDTRLAVTSTKIDPLTEQRYFNLRQLHGNIEVYGAQYKAITNTKGEIKKAMGRLYDLTDLPGEPKWSSTVALEALYASYPEIDDWIMAPTDTLELVDLKTNTAVIYPGILTVLPASLHPEGRHELTYRYRVDGLQAGEKVQVFLGATEQGLRLELSLIKRQQCPSKYTTESVTVETRLYGKRTIPTVSVCENELNELVANAFRDSFGLSEIPSPFTFYLLRNRSDDTDGNPVFFRPRYRTGVFPFNLFPNDIVNIDNKWNNPVLKSRGYLDTHWGLIQAWTFFNTRYGRTDYAQKGQDLKVEFEHIEASFWDRANKRLNLAGGLFTPETDLHTVAHEYAHAVSDNMAELIYFGEPGAIEESVADIFALVLHDQLQLEGPKWVYGFYDKHDDKRNFQDPHLENHPKFYEGKYWHDYTIFHDDQGGLHTNSSVMNHWFYLLSEGKKDKNERGQPYEVMSLGMMETFDMLYRALDLYMVSGSNFAQARQATIQAAEDIYGSCSDEARAVGTAWFAVGVGEPYPLCKDIWMTFKSWPDNGADVRIYLDSTREVTVVENEYKITKVINRPLLSFPSRWVVGNKVDGSVITSNVPMPTLRVAQRPESEVFATLGLALNKQTAPDSVYTAEDFDRDYMVVGGSKLTKDGILINKYRHPTMDNTFFWSAPQIEVPFMAHSWAMRFGSLAPDMNAVDNIFRGFLVKMEGPEVNFELEPHFYDVSKNGPLFSDAAVFTHYGRQSIGSPTKSKE